MSTTNAGEHGNHEKTRDMYSKAIHHSYGISGFLDNFFTGAFTIRVFSFYEIELLLPVLLVSIAHIIYGIWNMINDPLIGYICDKPYNFVGKRGRRYPWYMATSIPYAVAYLLIFTVPGMENTVVFLWLLFTICLFDTFYSFWMTNLLALFPTKFRNHDERTKVGAANTMWGLVGIVVGLLLPPLFISYGNVDSYIGAAAFVSLVGVISAILIIPGMREDDSLKALALKDIGLIQSQHASGYNVSLPRLLVQCFKQKNFVVYMMVYLAHMVLATLMLSSVPYWVQFIFGSSDPDAETIASAGLLIGVLVSIPVWMKVGSKHGNRKAYIYGAGFSAIGVLLFFLFAVDLVGAFVLTLVLGFGISAVWTLLYPAYSDVIDQITVELKQRRDGILTGIRTLFGRLPIVIQAIVIGLVHWLTGFDPDALPGIDTQTELARWGIRVHMSLVPFFFYLVAFFLVWRYYDLDLVKMGAIKQQLKELGL